MNLPELISKISQMTIYANCHWPCPLFEKMSNPHVSCAKPGKNDFEPQLPVMRLPLSHTPEKGDRLDTKFPGSRIGCI